MISSHCPSLTSAKQLQLDINDIICSFNLLLSPWVRGSVARSPSSFRQAQVKLKSTRCIFRLKIGYHYSSSRNSAGKCWELALFECNFKSSSSCKSDTEVLANRWHMPVRKRKTFTWCHAVAHSLLCLCQCRFSASTLRSLNIVLVQDWIPPTGTPVASFAHVYLFSMAGLRSNSLAIPLEVKH